MPHDPASYALILKRTPAQCGLQARKAHTTTTDAWEIAIDTTGRGVLHFISCATVDANTIPRVRITVDGREMLATFQFTGTYYYLQSVLGPDAATPVNLNMPFRNSLKIEAQRGGTANISIVTWYSLEVA